MAQWLFWQMSTLGVLKTEAKFIAAWKSGSLVAPSPTKPSTTVRSPLSLAAHAAPTAWGSCGPRQLDQETWFTLRPLMWEGICRPLRMSPALPKTCATYCWRGKPRTSIITLSRRAWKTQSPGSIARAAAMGVASCPVQAP